VSSSGARGGAGSAAAFRSAKPALSWEPVRRGSVYCAPACGMKCTWDDYKLALAQSSALVRRLGGKPWVPRVGENLGWHWEVRLDFEPATHEHDRSSIVVRRSGTHYRAVVQGKFGQFSATHYSDPKRAVDLAVKEFEDWKRKIDSFVKALNKTRGT
jgi:hypothetical protein